MYRRLWMVMACLALFAACGGSEPEMPPADPNDMADELAAGEDALFDAGYD